MTDEPELIEALRAEAYRVPLTLDAAAVRDRVARERRSSRLVRVASVLAAAVAVVAIAILVSRPGRPPVGGPSASPAASSSASPSVSCPLSDVVRHGSWWKEIGGPGAYFNLEPSSLHAGPNPWLVIVRFAPEGGAPGRVSMSAEHLASGDRVDAAYNSTMDPANIYRFSEPAPALPGGWYLFEQRVPEPGCWRLTGAIDGRVVGSAVIEVAPAAGALPTAAPATVAPVGGGCLASAFTQPTSTGPSGKSLWWSPGSRGECGWISARGIH